MIKSSLYSFLRVHFVFLNALIYQMTGDRWKINHVETKTIGHDVILKIGVSALYQCTLCDFFFFFPRLVVLPSHCVLAATSGRLKVNMGNIYVKQKNYPKAIKMYRMALDQVSNTNKEMRIKIMQNIGLVFVRMGQYTDAITSFEHIMGESPNIKTGFNLILCYFAIGDRERMKKAFQKLISVPLGIDDEDKYILSNVSVKFVFIFGFKAVSATRLTIICSILFYSSFH